MPCSIRSEKALERMNGASAAQAQMHSRTRHIGTISLTIINSGMSHTSPAAMRAARAARAALRRAVRSMSAHSSTLIRSSAAWLS
jgi:hypothetical protein